MLFHGGLLRQFATQSYLCNDSRDDVLTISTIVDQRLRLGHSLAFPLVLVLPISSDVISPQIVHGVLG